MGQLFVKLTMDNFASTYEKVVLEVPSDDDDEDSDVHIITCAYFTNGT